MCSPTRSPRRTRRRAGGCQRGRLAVQLGVRHRTVLVHDDRPVRVGARRRPVEVLKEEAYRLAREGISDGLPHGACDEVGMGSHADSSQGLQGPGRVGRVRYRDDGPGSDARGAAFVEHAGSGAPGTSASHGTDHSSGKEAPARHTAQAAIVETRDDASPHVRRARARCWFPSSRTPRARPPATRRRLRACPRSRTRPHTRSGVPRSGCR
jgi:hypothetical protein